MKTSLHYPNSNIEDDVHLINLLKQLGRRRGDEELPQKMCDIIIRTKEAGQLSFDDFNFIDKNAFDLIQRLSIFGDEFFSEAELDIEITNGLTHGEYCEQIVKKLTNPETYIPISFRSFMKLLNEALVSETFFRHENACQLLPQMDAQVHRTYKGIVEAVYQYLAIPMERRDNYGIFVPGLDLPSSLFDLERYEPYFLNAFNEKLFNPLDLVTFNQQYDAYAPDFYAIQQLAVSLGNDDSFVIQPETKSYSIEISSDTYAFAKERWNKLREIRQTTVGFSEAEEAEFNLLTDIVTAYKYNHKM